MRRDRLSCACSVTSGTYSPTGGAPSATETARGLHVGTRTEAGRVGSHAAGLCAAGRTKSQADVECSALLRPRSLPPGPSSLPFPKPIPVPSTPSHPPTLTHPCTVPPQACNGTGPAGAPAKVPLWRVADASSASESEGRRSGCTGVSTTVQRALQPLDNAHPGGTAKSSHPAVATQVAP